MTKYYDKEAIIKFYQQRPMSMDVLKEKFNLCKPTLAKVLKAAGVPRYTNNQIFNPNLNESYFETIDTANKAYLLGFIIADGCVFDNGFRSMGLTISVKQDDIEVLENCKRETGSSAKIWVDNRGCANFRINSQKMVDDLGKYGVVPHKTTSAYIPTNIPIQFQRDLLRGLFDGDGTCQEHKNYISICGTYEVVEFVRDLFVQKLNANNNKIYEYKNSKNFTQTGWRSAKDFKSISEYLYLNSELYLSRKNPFHDNTEISVSNNNDIPS